ncbi:MAG: methionine adenosyltransferase [Gammaproteobacteria bacterium]|nr:methionine adenosyltransferase [Gammaproteobacteria bacterium]MDH3858134.1 methionine adenosyltransferase [Gammaproteobacteria bacterium]
MSEIYITTLSAPSPACQPVEIVERKGQGHPDTVCDALAEELSRTLCRFYLNNFDFILHHNVDKVLLRGGTSRAVFGGGQVTQPMEIFLAGRATCEYKGKRVPVDELVEASCQNWLKPGFHALDYDRHVKIHSLIRPGSVELVDLYLRQQESGVALANDTSCGVGYAPLDDLERIVLEVEKHLNSETVKAAHPAIGEDIKVMGVRDRDTIRLTIACAIIDRFVADVDEYMACKAVVASLAQESASRITSNNVTIAVNTADDISSGSLYLTVTGTSAEAGDDGEVGRGNRANGLITPYRPMNMEAAAGKNPVTHVGKLYNVVAQRITDAIIEELAEVEEAYCYLVSSIGGPIMEPQVADLQVRLKHGVSLTTMQAPVRKIFDDQLNQMIVIRQELVDGTAKVY